MGFAPMIGSLKAASPEPALPGLAAAAEVARVGALPRLAATLAGMLMLVIVEDCTAAAGRVAFGFGAVRPFSQPPNDDLGFITCALAISSP
jgi:hypothetical protein